MTLRVLVDPAAGKELREATNWYESERPGLGSDLLTEVDVTIEHVLRWPDLAPRLLVPGTSRQVRRAPLRGFPFGIIYVVIDETLWVLAIAHGRRRPLYWRERIR